jgi:hypothetical protein
MRLGICAPAEEIALGKQIRAEPRKQAPPVEPVVAMESRFGQGLHRNQCSLKKGNVFSVDVRRVATEKWIVLVKPELAGLLGKKLTRFLKPFFGEGCEVGADFSLGGVCFLGHGF